MVTQFRSTETIKKVSLARDEKDRQSGPVFVSTAGGRNKSSQEKVNSIQ